MAMVKKKEKLRFPLAANIQAFMTEFSGDLPNGNRNVWILGFQLPGS
jgi:hypothetical protein